MAVQKLSIESNVGNLVGKVLKKLDGKKQDAFLDECVIAVEKIAEKHIARDEIEAEAVIAQMLSESIAKTEAMKKTLASMKVKKTAKVKSPAVEAVEAKTE